MILGVVIKSFNRRVREERKDALDRNSIRVSSACPGIAVSNAERLINQ